jgi:tRNA dimethylallyltransferase
MSNSKQKIYFVIGPTSSGKTALSIDLAKKLGHCEIISADSRQVYKDFDLSSGKVTEKEKEGIPHHLLDVVNPGQPFSVVDYTNLALEKIQETITRGNTPIVCGGTGFYIDSILYNYSLPNVSKNEPLRKKLEKKSTDELFKILKDKLLHNFLEKTKYLFFSNTTLKKFRNPDHGKNKHRLIRAIEIVEEMGYIPELSKTKRFEDGKFEVHIVSTQVRREELKKKIFSRLLERLNLGMIEEIRGVKEKYGLSFEYLEKLGLEFKWVAKLLQNQITKEQLIENLNNEIYQYARRQETWFKRYSKY